MPSDQFEVIFVDDGSPDDTFARLEQIQRARPNVRITRIENSGWPSRPRNIALDMARGEYVLFMDHDDELSPDALRAAYDLGHRNGADAVNGKESRTQFAGWSLAIFTENMDNAIGRVQPNPLMPMNPHKLYRRAFLDEHHIRFREGRRAIYEDIFFNIEVYKHAQVISLLSDTAFYHWVKTGDNNSSSYRDDVAAFWTAVDRVFAFIEEELSGEEHRAARESLIVHQFNGRGLEFFTNRFRQRSDAEAEVIVSHVRGILDRHMKPEFDVRMKKSERAKTMLLRLNRIDLLRDLSSMDAGVIGTTRATSVAWRDGKLRISGVAGWSGENVAGPDLIMTDDGRIERNLSDQIRAALPSELVDVSEEVADASAQLGIRNENDKSVWLLPTRTHMQTLVDLDKRVVVSIALEAEIDVDRAIFGRKITTGRWTFNSRNALLSHLNQRAVRSDVQAAPSLISGRAVVAYANPEGVLSLDVSQTTRSIVSTGRANFSAAVVNVDTAHDVIDFAIPLDAVAVDGRTVIDGWLVMRRVDTLLWRAISTERWEKVPLARQLRTRLPRKRVARLIGDEKGARLEGSLSARPGRYRITVGFGTKASTVSLTAHIRKDGTVSFART